MSEKIKVGGLELTPQSAHQSYRFGDESGYSFDVRANLDDEWGWSGSVTFSTFGAQTAEDSIRHLRQAAEHFLRMLTEETR
jgi:hypothetical protein